MGRERYRGKNIVKGKGAKKGGGGRGEKKQKEEEGKGIKGVSYGPNQLEETE